MLDLLLIFSLGFLGSFGHCAGMCGPITAAFSLSHDRQEASPQQQLVFHGLLNLGRLLSYVLIGAGIGALGSVLIAGGQMAGIGSGLRRGMAIFTGSLLIWFGLSQISPGLLPHLPFLHPLASGSLHQRLSSAMVKLSLQSRWWTPFLLGAVWGLIPCGFLYTAQIKAAETGNLWAGGATMLAFGLGTIPVMIGVGVSTALVSADRRSQLYRIGGWITLIIGILTLTRNGNTMVDYTGYGALVFLMLALAARPMSRFWAVPLQCRRLLGVGAFVLAVIHTLHMVDHAWQWNLEAIFFMLPQYQWGIAIGCVALLLMLPAALTSFDRAQKWLGTHWRSIHLLTVPALLFSGLHCVLAGSSYLGSLPITTWNWIWTGLLGAIVCLVLLIRMRWVWAVVSLERFYVPPHASKHPKQHTLDEATKSGEIS